MRPPAQLPTAILTAALGVLLGACDPAPAPPVAQAEIDLDEHRVMVGEVVERLEGQDYVYLRLALPHEGRAAPPTELRWVALDAPAPELGQRIRVRVLAHRTRVWDPLLARDFPTLDYVALLD